MIEKAAGRNVVALTINAPEELEANLIAGHFSGNGIWKCQFKSPQFRRSARSMRFSVSSQT